MNAQHLWAFCWLRYRLLVNQLTRGGLANKIILAILVVLGFLFALGAFVGGFLAGLFLMPKADPAVHMYIWDGLAVALLFSWATGVLTELQRSESLALEKFLHLPVSLWGAFLLNYLSSLMSVTLLLFLPVMIGLILGMIFGVGPEMILLLALLGAFLLMVTAVTYQFQGWLASLMVDKRRRRTVIVVATLVFVLVAQLPNLINMYYWRDSPGTAKQTQNHGPSKETEQWIAEVVGLVNVVVPPGWLALGAKAVAEGNLLTAGFWLLGMTFIGVVSLRRAYRTTLRIYTGHFTAGKTESARPKPAVEAPKKPAGPPPANMLERNLPWVSEPVAAIALAGFRSFLRAPEVKMILLSPIFMLVIFGGIFMRNPGEVSYVFRPLMVYAALCMSLLFVMNLLANQLGFDRGGFRIFVLAPVSRRDILLGKNLAVAPFAAIFAVIMVGAVQIFYPLSPDHLLAVVPQAISMYLLFCLQSNCLSILAPIAIPAGAVRPKNVKTIPVLLHLLSVFTFPAVMSLTLLPLAIESLLGLERVPVCLVLAVLECVGIVFLYRYLLFWQGCWLQYREQKILQTVTEKAA